MVSELAINSWNNFKLILRLKELAKDGNAYAQSTLGSIYRRGQPGVPKNKQQALFWYRKAVAQGDSSGQYGLGQMYFYGEGVPENDTEAVMLFRKAADQGDSRSQDMLANCYSAGLGVLKSYVQAVAWYRKAAEQGDNQAQYKLGLHFGAGFGTEKDPAQSLKWLLIAKANGSDDAEKYLKEYRSDFSSEEVALAQKLAAEWWSAHQPER